MAPPPALSHSTHAYLTLTFPPSSPFISNPALLSSYTSSLPAPISHISQVGELQDSHIYQVNVPKSEFERVKEQVLAGLKGMGKVRVMEEPKMRAKRGGEL